ncbi:MAG TPA: SLBB domain-containing protein [Nevskiaceae bacterium]|nr:SLBB domain-containing protein [Nevskiaceae bacterium]
MDVSKEGWSSDVKRPARSFVTVVLVVATLLLWPEAPAAAGGTAIEAPVDAPAAITAALTPASSLKMVPALRSAADGTAESAPIPVPGASLPLLQLGPGDAVTVQVYGRPEMTTTTYVADDGAIQVPLAGAVRVGGVSPAEAGRRIADALRGDYVLDPHVTVTLAQFRSQQVSVLGEVRSPGRYPVDSRITPFDLLAQAGGITEDGADTVVLIRTGTDGQARRETIDLRALTRPDGGLPDLVLRGGDSLFVPRAEQFYIYGEVHSPNMYRLEPGMTVIQAISRGGGITTRGSDRRIEIQRSAPDGRSLTVDAHPADRVLANDVIRVKERIF